MDHVSAIRRSRMHLRNGELVERRPWPADELAKAIRWRRERKGASFIAKQLGRTRNAVIAKLWREKEPGVLANQNRASRHVPDRKIPMTFREQANV